MGRFEGLTVVITGATGGGARCAERFAEGGAKLVLSDIDESRLAPSPIDLPGETEILAGMSQTKSCRRPGRPARREVRPVSMSPSKQCRHRPGPRQAAQHRCGTGAPRHRGGSDGGASTPSSNSAADGAPVQAIGPRMGASSSRLGGRHRGRPRGARHLAAASTVRRLTRSAAAEYATKGGHSERRLPLLRAHADGAPPPSAISKARR